MLKQLLRSSSNIIRSSCTHYQPISNPISTSCPNFKKSKNISQKAESDSDDEKADTYENSLVDKNSKIIDLKVTNLRLDGILKAGLGMARNKIELQFYESKIRRNGAKVMKKSESVDPGDEIDIVKGPSPTNPKLLTVARVEILSITPKDEYIALKLRRCKTLLIENYDDAWKPSSSSSST